MSLRIIALDLATIAAITVIGTVMATQTVPVEDWRIWLRGLAWGIAYRTLPEALQYVVLVRAKYLPERPSGPPPLPDAPLVIGGDGVDSDHADGVVGTRTRNGKAT